MNANDRFYARDAHVDAAAVAPLPNSRKVFVAGSRDDIRVPMREIAQSDTPATFGAEKNPAIVVYDTSGPYTDPAATIDIRKGLRGIAFNVDRRTRGHGRAPRTDLRVSDASGSPIASSPACASISTASRVARAQAPTSRRCITRAAGS